MQSNPIASEEADLHLRAARARRDVHLAEKQLALSRLEETQARLQIERYHVQKASERLDAAELAVGRVRLLARRARKVQPVAREPTSQLQRRPPTGSMS